MTSRTRMISHAGLGYNQLIETWITSLPQSPSSVPIHMLPIPTLDQAHHSHRAAWATQLPPSSLHSTRIRHTGTELRWNIVSALLLMLRTNCSSLREPGEGHENVLYNHIFNMPSSQVPPLFTDWGSGFQIIPVLGLDLNRKC